jgi:hypothetical protein
MYVEKPLPGSDLCRVLMISITDAQYGSHTFQHNFGPSVAQRGALCQKFLVIFRSLDKLPVMVVIISIRNWLAMKTPKILCLPQIKSRGLKYGDRAGRLTGPPRPIHFSPKI